ncbi:TetR family transcriptional regulator [Arthrobacter sp. SW1]|uniref:TetR/AcrR family transcriptional regulator n=1 Tax=Arthrobacter sp. SW1 TaxID=1920889 RepID=UPI000877B8A7|nr:TetR/AcrR family transcriptional regulator C-terminal domain-containing protein [Arthrobacter sp. SW1]OFI38613.1 TetR family transcriptional regulator [Arthrobacter sp. SW1]
MAQPAPRDGRVRLTPESIIDAVIRLSREEPGERLTFRRLGQELGVDASAMYRHFRNRDAIVRAALDRLFQGAVADAQAAAGREDWRSRLEAYFEALMAAFIRHPALGRESFALDTYGPGELQSIEFVLECLTEAGLPHARVVHYYAALESHALALGAGIAREIQQLPGSAGHDPWLSPGVFTQLAGHPLLEAHHPDLARLDSLGTFRAGLAAILDSASREGSTIRS